LVTQSNMKYPGVLEDGDVTIMCLAAEDTRKSVIWNFIDSVKDSERSSTLTEKSLKKLVTDANDPANDKISVLKNKIEEVQEVMIINIDKLIQRGKDLEDLVQVTDEMNVEAEGFLTGAKKVRNSNLRKWILYIIILVLILAIILGVIIWFACGFPSFYRCIPQSQNK